MMMSVLIPGLEVLNVITKERNVIVVPWFTIAAAALVLGLMVIGSINFFKGKKKGNSVVGECIFLTGLVLAILTIPFAIDKDSDRMENKSKKVRTETLYQVTISDDVKFYEFVEKYEVIKVEGELYTIKIIEGN